MACVGNPEWKKGNSGNPKGRPKGAKNAFPTAAKPKLQAFIIERLDSLGQLWEELDAGQRAKFLPAIMQFVLPKQTQDTTLLGEDITVTINRNYGKKK